VVSCTTRGRIKMRISYLVRERNVLSAVVRLVGAASLLAVVGCGGGSSTHPKDGGGDAASSTDVPTGTTDTAVPDTSTTTSPDGSPDAITKCVGGAHVTSGAACGCNADCQSAFCVDGVCCDTACTDTCKACNVPGAMGTCSFVPEGFKPGAGTTCPTSDVATCGLDGT